MAVMQSNTQTQKGSSKRGLVIMLGGASVAVSVAMMNGINWMPSAPAQPVQEQASPVTVSNICEDGNCITQDAIDAQLARLALTEQAMNDDGIQCKFVDEVGRQDCIGRIASIKKRWRQ